MKYYLIQQEGRINESLALRDGEVLYADGVIEISEDDYKKISGKQEYFEYQDKKVKEVSPAKRKQIDDRKKEWQENNTIPGLQARIAALEAKLDKK